MAFNVSSFKSNGLIYGGARPTLFDVSFTAPPGVPLTPSSVNKFQFLCTAAQLPASTVTEIAVPYFGRQIKIAGDRTFQDWTVTILNDEDFAIRSMMELWSNALNQMVANLRVSSSDSDYKTDITVQQYGKDGEVIRSYQLVGAFPTAVDPINLNWNSTNQVEEFNTTFAYDYWIPLVETSSKSQGINVYGPDGASQSS